MFRAVGYSETEDFNPFKPGRLCRGRERWITPWEAEEGASSPELTRLVITGAAFDDDSARDALRGLTTAEVDLPGMITALFPNHRLVVFTEDGHPADIPDDAQGVELYDGYRAAGKTRLPLVRWYKVLDRPEQLAELGPELVLERIRGLAVVDKKADLEALWERLFLLVGMANMDSPPARYNPAALPDVLELAKAVVIFHRDKHGPVLGVYSPKPIPGATATLGRLAEAQGVLLVPFQIPPMLARWDRALYELRNQWEQEHEAPFPVPRSEAPSHWESRRTRRKRDKDRPGDELDQAIQDLEATTVAGDAPAEE